MAIDGRIIETREHPDGVELVLGPRPAQTIPTQGGEIAHIPESIPGQPTVVIEGATWTPHVGDEIWGGSGSARIESGGFSFPYKRTGYTRLREAW